MANALSYPEWDRYTKDVRKFWKKYFTTVEESNAWKWVFCPWCGKRLAITPSAHDCTYPDID